MSASPEQRWTPREIAIVSDERLSLHEMAHQTGRTYQACADYRRHNGLSQRRAEQLGHRSTAVQRVLCACGSQDDDHQDWCPQ